ncbi:MAG TPA: DNA repair protein RecN [Burkholderiales bacterium]|nr:DNA repair protein RecN [Burkholderiales bacterium]
MLRALDVSNLVLIEKASLELGEGFTCLTGETGAGKSMLVDAIELLVGGRADAGLVREGAERAELSAEFEVKDKTPLADWLVEADLAGDPGMLILRRSIDRSGRSRCFINGHAATLAQLKSAGEHLIDIHGQHEHQSLLRPAAQRVLLDAHAGAEDLARQTADAYRDWKRLQAVADEAEKNFAQREAERDELKSLISDLKKLGLREGEWQEVSAEHTRLQHGSSLLGGAQSALEALAEAEGAALSQLAAVANRLKALSAHDDRLKSVVELLESAEAQASEAVRDLRNYASRVELDPQALRDTEARIEALHAAARKFRVRPEALPAKAAELGRRFAELELAVNPEALRKEVAASHDRYESVSRKLSTKRRAGAEALGKAVTAAMQKLAMAGGRFAVKLNLLEQPSAMGAEETEFEVSSHASLPLRPLAKVASGGELSRVSLAIQLVAASASPVGALVFDEIDSGIGGGVAETIGKALRQLGKQRQVLCVTHLPQVAASGNDQWSVLRSGTKEKVRVTLIHLDRGARIAELARMLGGAESTARKHAAELLDEG